MITAFSKDYPTKFICQVLSLPRSTYYDIPAAKTDDERFLAAIEKIIMKRPYYGYRRITHQLKRKGYEIGETRVRRLLKQLEHSCSAGKAYISTTRQPAQLTTPPEPDQRSGDKSS